MKLESALSRAFEDAPIVSTRPMKLRCRTRCPELSARVRATVEPALSVTAGALLGEGHLVAGLVDCR
ncbi:hypothetical protein ADL15_14595 [Actinoplanes awajinensis subsp. mycoplanecinus]|uniref:Uncharacterized protein n=1 Tax=Actinoplanes awajinensis subsp. mycoplanecinus TaxID=135947 RepID=A0A0X3URN0_9ACTN|nr:hypothetical protein ADL15_14595 [Actinoplanes awajinensis subsp. mycoplanecinus]